MPNPPAALALICALPTPDITHPQVLRVVGRVIGLDIPHSTLLLQDEDAAVIVDFSVVLDVLVDTNWAPRLKDLIMVHAYLCFNDGSIEIPSIEASLLSPSVSSEEVLRAFLIKPCEELDLERWREAVRATTLP